MKHTRIIIIATVLVFGMQPAIAESDNLVAGDLMNYIGYGVIMFMLSAFVVAMLMVLRALRVVIRLVLRKQGLSAAEIEQELHPATIKREKKPKAEMWQKLLSLKPMSQERELLIAHDYDGIQELDNPIPAWFMYLFYGTIIFAAGYLLNYHVFKTGQLQYAEYNTEIAQADIAKKIFLSKAANQVNENTVKLVHDPAVIASGEAIFKKTCAPCHGEHAQGSVGPNLTDDYWLHGSKINDLFKTINYGVVAKGMPTWEKQLSPKQIADVANYIKSLQGSKPAGAKEPQGIKDIEGANKLAANN